MLKQAGAASTFPQRKVQCRPVTSRCHPGLEEHGHFRGPQIGVGSRRGEERARGLLGRRRQIQAKSPNAKQPKGRLGQDTRISFDHINARQWCRVKLRIGGPRRAPRRGRRRRGNGRRDGQRQRRKETTKRSGFSIFPTHHPGKFQNQVSVKLNIGLVGYD